SMRPPPCVPEPTPGGSAVMPVRRNVVVRFFVLGTCSLLLVGIAAAAMPLVKGWWQPKDTDGSSLNPHDSSIRLVTDRRKTFTVSPGVIQTLNVQTADVEKASHPRQLRLSGFLAF